ncbi:T9SS type A sorting domain-containing protein [Candidatus Neomarinimicrobiota bacterium]
MRYRNIQIANIILFILSFSFTTLHAQLAVFSPDTLFMGKIPVSSTAMRQLIIYNTDVNDLSISSLQIVNDDNNNFSILDNPGSITLGIAGSIILDIVFSPNAIEIFEAEISVESNTTNGAAIIPIFGEGVSNSPPYFERIFGRVDGGGLGSIQETPDGGYILVGSTPNPDEEVNDIYIVKTDAFGEIEWTNILVDEDRSEGANAIVLTDDEHYMMLGETRRDNFGDPDLLLLKLDLSGNIEWSKTYGGEKDDNSTSLVKTSDDGYLLVGYSDSFNDGSNKDIYVVKVDEEGNEVWTETYGGNGGESASEVINTSDGGYAIVGKTDSKGAGGQDIWLLKLNANGNLDWDKTYGGSDRDGGSDVAEFPDGGYAITGYAIGFGPGATDMFLIGTDELGNELWNSAFGETYRDGASNVLIVDDGIIIAGNIEVIIAPPFEYSDIFVIKTDIDGEELWRKQFGGRFSEGASEMILNSDGHIVITGSTGSYSKDNSVYFLNISGQGTFLNISDQGEITLPTEFFIYPNYPNPFNSTTTISYQLINDNQVMITIYDILGNKIQTLLDSYQLAGRHRIGFEAEGLASGTYFFKVQTQSGALVSKMMYLK